MVLSKHGIVYAVLKWYGYPDWRLKEGISLCKMFWSIMLGALILGPFRTLFRVLLWHERVGQSIARRYGVWLPVYLGLLELVWFSSLLTLWIVHPKTFEEWNGWWVAVGTLNVVVLVFVTSTMLALEVPKRRRKKATVQTEPQKSEVGQIVIAFLRAVREKACPIITFEEKA